MNKIVKNLVLIPVLAATYLSDISCSRNSENENQLTEPEPKVHTGIESDAKWHQPGIMSTNVTDDKRYVVRDDTHAVEGDWNLYLYDLETKKGQNITQTPNINETKPSIEGNYIVYLGETENRQDIYVMNHKTGEKANLTENITRYDKSHPEFKKEIAVFFANDDVSEIRTGNHFRLENILEK